MSKFQIYPASEVDLVAFVRALNEAYKNYYVWIEMSPNSIRALIERDSIDMSASVAVMEGDKIVGIGLLAIRQPSGWIGGVGTLPSHRRQGVARLVMEGLIAKSREHGLAYVELEVITQNTGAYLLYQDLNFVTRRLLHVMERDPLPLSAHKTTGGYQILYSSAEEALEYYRTFHDVNNPWQRELASLRSLAPHMTGRMIVAENNPDAILGYAVGWIEEEHIRLLDFAIRPGTNRTPIAQALLASLHQEQPNATGNILNVPEEDTIYEPLLDCGYRAVLSQYEMRLDL